jgi:hypothetical protein
MALSTTWLIAEPSQAPALAESADLRSKSAHLAGLDPVQLLALVRTLFGPDCSMDLPLLHQEFGPQGLVLVTQVAPELVAALAGLDPKRRPQVAAEWQTRVSEERRTIRGAHSRRGL